MFAVLFAADFLLETEPESDQLRNHFQERRLVDLARRGDDPTFPDKIEPLAAWFANLLQVESQLQVFGGVNGFVKPAE
jgi:hypothetical protein